MQVGTIDHGRTEAQLRALFIQLHSLLVILLTVGIAILEANGQIVEGSGAVTRRCGLPEEGSALVRRCWSILFVELMHAEKVQTPFVALGGCLDIETLCLLSVLTDKSIEQACLLVFIASGLVDVAQLSDCIWKACCRSLFKESERNLVIVGDLK